VTYKNPPIFCCLIKSANKIGRFYRSSVISFSLLSLSIALHHMNIKVQWPPILLNRDHHHISSGLPPAHFHSAFPFHHNAAATARRWSLVKQPSATCPKNCNLLVASRDTGNSCFKTATPPPQSKNIPENSGYWNNHSPSSVSNILFN